MLAKIDQQSQWIPRDCQVAYDLSQVAIVEAIYGFDFYDNFLFDYKIRDVITNKTLVVRVIGHWEKFLFFERYGFL